MSEGMSEEMSEGMSEDERKQIIEFITKDLKALGYNEYLIGIIKETFDLYQKEKDLNQELQIRYKIENDKYKEEKEKNIKLDQKFKYAVPDEIVDELYISKDKIREKIKKLEDKVHIVIPNEYNKTEIINEFKNEGAINALQELLEENNEM